jgi:hypothetical protein
MPMGQIGPADTERLSAASKIYVAKSRQQGGCDETTIFRGLLLWRHSL